MISSRLVLLVLQMIQKSSGTNVERSDGIISSI